MMRTPMARRPLPLLQSVLRQQRWLSAATPANKSINLTPYASPLLLRLHPDRMQRFAKTHGDAMRANEEALKQLNQFLEIASFGCNNDGYRARKQILSLAEENHDDPNAAITWTLRFHVENEQTSEQLKDEQLLLAVDHVVVIPSALVRRTLAHGAHLAASAKDNQSGGSPFAREWQRTTKRTLQRLFDAAQIPLHNENETSTQKTPTQLALWLAQEDPKDVQHGQSVTAHNTAMQRVHQDFDKMFMGLLAKEKNIVHTTTTGLEVGPTTQHAILTRLVAQRLFLEKIDDREEKKRIFNWLANFLLVHFMELRLHSLVWNKVMLMVTKDASLETPQVLWDHENPEQGMALLIPADMDSELLVDTMYAHIDELERALQETTQVPNKNRSKTTFTPKKRKKKHFYADEVSAMFRNR